MKLIKSKVEILDNINGEEVINKIAKVARTCYKSEDASTAEKDKKLVENLVKSGHEAMIEFFDITVKFTCDRGVSHELVRHRMASFAQESTRYCNYSKDKFNNELTFIIPNWAEVNKFGEIVADDNEAFYDFKRALEMAEAFYLSLIAKGWTAEKARMVLPMSIKTEINMKANLREWRHFFKLRCSTAAHLDIRVLALDLLKQMHNQIPIIFDDIYEKYGKDSKNEE